MNNTPCYLKVTPTLLRALGFVEQTTLDGIESVKTNQKGDQIRIPGTVEEIVTECAACGVSLPRFIETLMGYSAIIAEKNALRGVVETKTFAQIFVS